LVLLPSLSVVLFGAISALSFVEIKHRLPQVKISPVPVSAEVLARYQEQSRELKGIRESSREKLTADDLLSALEKKPEEIPGREMLLAELRAIEARTPETGAALFPRLLLFLEKASRESGDETRLQRAEALISHLIFSSDTVSPGEDDRRRLLGVLEGALERQSRAAAAYLVLLARTGQAGDLDCLRSLEKKARSPQLAREFSKTIAALETKLLAKN